MAGRRVETARWEAQLGGQPDGSSGGLHAGRAATAGAFRERTGRPDMTAIQLEGQRVSFFFFN